MESKNPLIVIIASLVIVAAIAGIVWYSRGLNTGSQNPPPAAQPTVGTPIHSPDLGTSLYEQVNNPIQNKLPASVAPVSNPIEGVYKNPFE